MADSEGHIRHSRAETAELIRDPEEKARREARNALLQIVDVEKLTDQWIDPERPFKLRMSMILGLHRVALVDGPDQKSPTCSAENRREPAFSTAPSVGVNPLDGLSVHAGNFRPAGVNIEKSDHEPPGAHMVPEFVEALCDYVNDNWVAKSPIHLAAYVLWRLNWIHPFDDGNGRTSRAVSYLFLCVKLESQLPSIGHDTIPELIIPTALIIDLKSPNLSFRWT